MTALLPVVFVAACLVSFEYPGDEYGLWIAGHHAGWPGLLLFESVGDIGEWKYRLALAASGAIVFAGIGALLDWMIVARRRFLMLALGLSALLVGWQLMQFPSMARAIAKNGSVQAYVLASIAPGIELAAVGMIGGRIARRLFFGGRRGPQGATVAREDEAR